MSDELNLFIGIEIAPYSCTTEDDTKVEEDETSAYFDALNMWASTYIIYTFPPWISKF